MKKCTAKLTIILFVSMLLLIAITGCTTGGEKSKGTVKLGYVNWAEGVAMTNLAQAVLEDKMDYEVDITMADAAPIFTSVAKGNYDAFLDAWLPITHESYMERYGDDLIDLGYNYEGARIGLVVPSYVDIDSIEELNEVKDKFDGQIVGIDSGAGIMTASERALQDYDLDYELMTGSGPTMTAALKKAIDNEDWVVVTGWTPHWKFARWDLKFLDDPKNAYGEEENIHTVARKDIKEDMPEVAAFLENFKMDDQQLGDLMGAISDSDGEAIDAAREWMNENEELVNSWIPAE
ncbi:glycine betaine ABC transporter substrate-binding protein [Irregularibacter muris]|uniref:Glycine betaine ABC transporter substrate-binding protein n=1 Tax=Irregularibacter muris TaxID=1796619 RepID=A0AAE3KZD2_9FIRM|nr:glycine betaine ABC transporter substrate-binding protein [Irregularibacter muris]MCR1898546.1 glycine betaine ABC transporter substrate-binding protein [Irregularibacter muris]